MGTYSFPVIGSDADGSDHLIIPWDKSFFPSGASQATVTPSAVVVWAFNNSTSTPAVPDLYGLWSWASTAGGGLITSGAQVAIGCSFPNDGSNSAILQVSLKVNNKNRLKSLWLELRDDTGNNDQADVLASVSGSWQVLSLTGVNISGWTGARLYATLTAVGTDLAANAGATELYVEWLAVST
jgi:hypothetical protein